MESEENEREARLRIRSESSELQFLLSKRLMRRGLLRSLFGSLQPTIVPSLNSLHALHVEGCHLSSGYGSAKDSGEYEARVLMSVLNAFILMGWL